MRPPDDPLSDESLEAGRAELRKIIVRRMFEDMEPIPRPLPSEEELQAAREESQSRAVRAERHERIVGIAVLMLVALFVLVGLTMTGDDESPCILTAAVGYPECVEDLEPGIRIEWPWSRPT